MNEQLQIIISAETSRLRQGVQDAQRQVKSFREQVKDASKNVDDNFKSIGASIGNAAKTIGTTVAATGAALLALGASTAEYRNEQAKLKTAFEDAGGSAAQATDTYNDLYRVLGDGGQAVEAANHLAKLTTEEKALNEWTTICQGAYATFGSSLPIESMTEAANEAAKTGSLTGALADALNWAGVSEDAFQESLDACNTEAEREALIRSTLIGLYGEAAATYEENNAQVLAQNEANAKLQATMATLGEAVAPVVTAFTSFASDALAVVVPYIQQLSEQYMPMLESALSAVSESLGVAFGFIQNNWEILLGIGAVIGTIVTAIGLYNAVAAVKAAMDAMQVTTLAALVAGYLAQAAAMAVAIAPYALIVAAIAGFIAIVVKAYKENETFRNIVDKVFNNIKSIIQSVMNIVKSIISTVISAIKSIWDNGLKQVLNVVINILARIAETFTSKLNVVLTYISSVFSNIANVIKSNLETAKTIVTNVLALIKAIFTGDLGAAKTAVSNIFNAIADNIRTKIEAAKNIVKSGIQAIKNFFNFKWELPKLKLPHFSISGKFSLNPPSIPKFSVSWYQFGGVFDSPTLFPLGNGIGGLGENGAEAIVPLEKNTQWLDRIADRLSAKQSSAPIVLEVDGKRFAQISIDSINQLTKQTGSLPLKLA